MEIIVEAAVKNNSSRKLLFLRIEREMPTELGTSARNALQNLAQRVDTELEDHNFTTGSKSFTLSSTERGQVATIIGQWLESPESGYKVKFKTENESVMIVSHP